MSVFMIAYTTEQGMLQRRKVEAESMGEAAEKFDDMASEEFYDLVSITDITHDQE